MPAKDHYHDNVKHSLTKNGWIVTAEQYFIKFYARRLWIDIQAQQADTKQSILIEVKGFENPASPVEYLEAALGQYVLYQAVLEELNSSEPLYLAVPTFAFEGFLSEPIGQIALQKAAVKLLTFDPELEETVKWIH